MSLIWRPQRDKSRVSQLTMVQLVVAFHRRRYRQLEVSVDQPLPEIHPRKDSPHYPTVAANESTPS